MFSWFKQFKYKRIEYADLEQYFAQKENKTFIDIRSKHTFKQERLKGFKSIPLDKLSKRLQELSKDHVILVLGDNQNPGEVACRLLKRKGYPHVINVLHKEKE